MNKESFLKELDNKLNRLSIEVKQEELNKYDKYIENSKLKGVSEEDIFKSLGSVDDLVETIYIQRGIKSNNKKNSFKNEILAILKGIKNNFLSKDKSIILNTIGKIVTIIIVAIIIKIPIIFLKTLLLDSLNSMNVGVNIQNIISGLFEVLYVVIFVMYIYKRLSNCFGSKK